MSPPVHWGLFKGLIVMMCRENRAKTVWNGGFPLCISKYLEWLVCLLGKLDFATPKIA